MSSIGTKALTAEDTSQTLMHEPHVFRLTLMMKATGGAAVVIVSWDGSITHIIHDDDYWIRQFKSGENKFYAQGYWDLRDDNIYVGERVEGLSW